MLRGASLFVLASAVAGVGCHSQAMVGMDPNTAFAAAHDIQVKAKLAEVHFDSCKADNTQCDPLFADLRAIQETSDNLSKASIAAGAKP